VNDLMHLLGQDLDPDDPDSRDVDFIQRYGIPATLALRRYFRAELEGEEYMPAEGPVVAVSNHSGGPLLPDCWVLLSYYWTLFSLERPAYAMVHDAVFRVPYLRNFMLRIGALRASIRNAEKVLDRGGVLLVFPGGDLDCFRSFANRNRIDFFGHAGFIELAMRYGAPLVPVVNAGGHETVITIHSSRALARWTGLDRLFRMKTVPINIGLPWGLWVGQLPFLPLPAKFSFKVGKPFQFREDAALHRDPVVVQRAYAAIVDGMQDMLDELASRRRLPVVG
jgi:1-acyl-sn-glycerol-3-phosphate acyltransferase